MIRFLKEGLISYPMEFRSSKKEAREVVPVPRKGSRTVSPTKENIFINLRGISIGKAAPWFLFCFKPFIFQLLEKNVIHSSLVNLDSSLIFLSNLGSLPFF